MRRFVFVFVFALVLATIASYGLYLVLGGKVSAAGRPEPVSQLLIATRNLQVGTVLAASDLEVVKWPHDAPPEALSKPAEAIGRGVVATIYMGEPVLGSRLAAQGAGVGLAATIPTGKRAVALKVNEVIGLAGFVLPGMHVDVIASGAESGGAGNTGGLISRTVLQNIEVISAGQKLERSNDGKPVEVQVVNLLVTPSQAEILSLVSTEAKVQLVLRNPLDSEEQRTPGVLLRDVLTAQSNNSGGYTGTAPARNWNTGPQASARPVPIKFPPHLVEVFNGVKKTEAAFY
ncbi:MAG: Flp pilus assembly protein CpaB [Bryobacteraceae bacterium]